MIKILYVKCNAITQMKIFRFPAKFELKMFNLCLFCKVFIQFFHKTIIVENLSRPPFYIFKFLYCHVTILTPSPFVLYLSKHA